MQDQAGCALRIGAFELRPERGVLVLGHEEFHLEPKICDVLCRLAKNAGDMVGRNELLDDVWGRAHGADESLTRAISQLRKTLRHDHERQYIETVPKKGYRLTAPVSRVKAGERPVAPSSVSVFAPGPVAGERSRRFPTWVAGGLGAGLALVLSVLGLATLQGGQGDEVVDAAFDDVVVLGAFQPITSADAEADAELLANQMATRLPSILSRNGVRPVVEDSPAQPRYRMAGSIETVGDQVSAALQLTSIESGEVIWAMLLERNASGASSFATEAAARFAGALGCAMGLREPGETLSTPLLSRLMSICDGLRLSQKGPIIEHARVLLEEDRNRARALGLHAILSERHHPALVEGDETEMRRVMEEVAAAAEEAAALDPDSSIAQVALAVTRSPADLLLRDEKLSWSAATQGTARTYALWRRSELMRETGRIGEAIRLANTILLHDPYHPTVHAELGWLHRTLGRFQTARRFLDEALLLDPESMIAEQRRMMMIMIHDPVDEARIALATTPPPKEESEGYGTCFERYLDMRDDVDRAQLWSPADLVEVCGGIPNHFRARLLGSIGYHDAAYGELDLLMNEMDGAARVVLFYPEFEAMRREARFWALFEKGGLPAYWLDSGEWPDFCQLEDLGYDCRDMARQVRDKAV